MQTERDHTRAELQDLNRQVRQKHLELDRIHDTLRRTSDSPAPIEHRLTEKQEPPERGRVVIQAPPAQHPAAADEPVESSAPPVSPAAGEGFTLRFASGAVLERLVAERTVGLYGMVDKQAWRLSLPDGLPSFTPDAFPARYHEMTPATVPAAYVQALGRTPGIPRGRAVIWGVRLPPQTQRAIADLARNLQGGDLVIRSDGKVYLNEQAPRALGRQR